MYPIINHIDEIMPYVLGNKNFSVNRKDDYIVVDYILNTPDLFQNEWEKECRGIIFDAYTGKVISRPYHKFFNVNERPESVLGYDYILDQNHVVLEKLDGSMIRCFKTGDRWIWGSKAGETFLTPQIDEFVKDKPQYMDLVKAWEGWTLIWEWCSRKNRIVVDHPQDRLVLTGLRENVTGKYFDYRRLKIQADSYGVEIVKKMNFHADDVKHVTDENFEGIVVRFDTGHMVKVKTDKYVRYHRAKDEIGREKNVIALLVNGQADDTRGLLSPDDLRAFEKFENDFFIHVGRKTFKTWEKLMEFMSLNMTKKTFALEHQNEVPRLLRSIFFKYFECGYYPSKTVIYEDIINILRRKVNSQTSVDEAREIFVVNWNDYYNKCGEDDNG